MQLHSRIVGSQLYKMVYRHPVILAFPAIFLTWYLVVQSWPRNSIAASPKLEIPPPPITIIATSTPTATLYTTATPTPSSAPSETPIEDHAYVFYATSDSYACSALVNFHRLRTIFNSKVPGIILASSQVSNATISVLRRNGLEVIRDEAPPIAANGSGYYQGVLLKLRALRLHYVKPRLKRIQVLDADQLILKNLDPLFGLPSVDIAAPLAYWLDGASVATTLLVANLSDRLWTIVDDAMRTIRGGEYDMDLINRVLRNRLMVLPGRYCTLNSHWEALDTPGWFGDAAHMTNATDEELVQLFKEAEIIHYTASGKPWNVDLEEIGHLKPRAHPLLREQFRLWKEAANGVCRFNYPHRMGRLPTPS